MNLQLLSFTYFALAFVVPRLSANPALSEDAEVCDQKEFFVHFPRRGCKQCDDHCTPGHCFDFVGCVQCTDGFYLVNSEQGTPFECLECVLPNCQTCVASAVECGGPAICIQCIAGFMFDENFNCMSRALNDEAAAPSSLQEDSEMGNVNGQEALARRGEMPNAEQASVVRGEVPSAEQASAVRGEMPNAEQASVVRGESLARDSPSQETASELAMTDSDSAPAPTSAPDVAFDDSVALYMDLEEEPSPSISASEETSTALGSPIEDAEEEEGLVSSSSSQRSRSDIEAASSMNAFSSMNASFSDSPCPMSHFLWNVSIPCIKCDDHAAPGACANFIGCVSCLPGYYRQRLEKDSPFICAPCTVPNCAVCEDGVLMHSTARCEVCMAGFNLIEATGSCIPA